VGTYFFERDVTAERLTANVIDYRNRHFCDVSLKLGGSTFFIKVRALLLQQQQQQQKL
jgi:hypothetical protein